MKWQDVREHYPEQWLLIEAISAISQDGNRIVEDMAVVDAFDDSREAFSKYRELHRISPEREFYVLHTNRDILDINERWWPGIRIARR